MTFLPVVEAFNLEDVFFFFFRNNIGICGRKIMAATLFLSSAMPKTSLIVLIFLTCLALVGALLPTRHVRKGKVSELILFKIFLLG